MQFEHVGLWFLVNHPREEGQRAIVQRPVKTVLVRQLHGLALLFLTQLQFRLLNWFGRLLPALFLVFLLLIFNGQLI